MGGETAEPNTEYPEHHSITSGLIPVVQVAKKYERLHKSVQAALKDLDEAHPSLDTVQKYFDLFHPNDVDKELLITRTLTYRMMKLDSGNSYEGIMLSRSLIEFMRANLQAAKQQLET